MQLTPDQCLDIKSISYERDLDLNIIDSRVEGLIDSLDVRGIKILDIGTLDGFHAYQLAHFGAIVTASDIRPFNLQRALFRSLYKNINNMKFRLLDMETMHQEIEVDEFDVIFHSGCFYHIGDPISHLKNIAPLAQYILLETHIANPIKYPPLTDLHGYKGTWYPEGNWDDSRAAKNRQDSFWLTKESLEKLFNDCGLNIIKTIYENAFNEHGNRNCYLLSRIG